MDFSTVVRRIQQQFVDHTASPSIFGETEPPEECQAIYGRVCTTRDGQPPKALSSDAARNIVFVFGPDIIQRILLGMSVSELFNILGCDTQYLRVVQAQRSFWLVLFTLCPHSTMPISVVPAKWEGVIHHVQLYYPDLTDDLLRHMHILKEQPFEEFEKEAGFRFIDSKMNKNREQACPPYFGYKHLVSLPKPRTAWQMRAFLFCELRLLKLYCGDGYTITEDKGEKGTLEYLCLNVAIHQLASTHKCAILPLKATFS